MEVTLSLTESGYYGRWSPEHAASARSPEQLIGGPQILAFHYDEEGKPVEPPDTPPLPRTTRVVLSAQPVSMHAIGAPREDLYLVPVVAETPQRFLRPAASPGLGTHTFLFAGEITVCDRYRLRRREQDAWVEIEGSWRVDLIVDCGVPLHFTFGNEWYNRPVPRFRETGVARGVWAAGLARIREGWASGLCQPVEGTIRRMQVLGLDPEEEGFGALRDVPPGYRLHLDPDTIAVPFVFMTIEPTAIHPVVYRPSAGRVPECPEPGPG